MSDKVKKCKRCGRPLTTTTSIERGYGDYCYKLYLGERRRKHPLFKIVNSNKKGVQVK